MKTLNYNSSKVFWDNRAEKLGNENFLLATTLQDDLPAISDYRDVAEKKHLFSRLKLTSTMKVLDLGGKVITLSDSGGTIVDEAGVDRDKLAYVLELKNIRRGRTPRINDEIRMLRADLGSAD